MATVYSRGQKYDIGTLMPRRWVFKLLYKIIPSIFNLIISGFCGNSRGSMNYRVEHHCHPDVQTCSTNIPSFIVPTTATVLIC